MTSIVAMTASTAPLPVQIKAVARTGADSESAQPAYFAELAHEATGALILDQAQAQRAATPVATTPLAPSVLAVMLEVQEQLADGEVHDRARWEAARAVARTSERRTGGSGPIYGALRAG